MALHKLEWMKTQKRRGFQKDFADNRGTLRMTIAVIDHQQHN